MTTQKGALVLDIWDRSTGALLSTGHPTLDDARQLIEQMLCVDHTGTDPLDWEIRDPLTGITLDRRQRPFPVG